MRKPTASVTNPTRTGPVRRFGSLHVFACEGLICILDEEEDCQILTPTEAQFRIYRVMASYRGRKPVEYGPKFRVLKRRKELQEAQGILECIKEAREMGDPSSPEVQAFWSRHRASRHVSFGALKNEKGERVLPNITGIGGSTPQNPSPTLVGVPSSDKIKDITPKLILPS